MAKSVVFLLCSVLACIAGQRITTIQLDGVQYFISRMNPYSPELNYFLAYQYCRSLGLQLASFETKEKVESMTTYLQNAGYSKYDFWTSGNRLGTGMFLWMSTGLPFNATFDYFENSADAVQAGLLDPVDHNSNTSPQRTARDSSSGLEKGCVMLKAPSLKWTPEDCSAVKDFICEQTRCYYYNYGSIPVSSAQGRPITSTTTTRAPFYSTTPLPHLFSSTFASFVKKSEENLQDISEPSLASLKMAHEDDVGATDEEHDEIVKEDIIVNARANTDNHQQEFDESEQGAEENHQDEDDIPEHEEGRTFNEDEKTENEQKSDEVQNVESTEKETEQMQQQKTADEVPPVEQRLKQISQEIEKYGSAETPETDIGHQSFLSLSDLIRTLRPNDKNIPHIDSDYSNTMRVLGETSSLVSTDESRKLKDSNSDREINRGLF